MIITEEMIEAAGQAIRAELRPERKDSGPLYLDHDVWEYRNMASAALEAALKLPQPKVDPFPWTYPYKGMLSDGRGRQSMSRVSREDVVEDGVRFEPRPEFSQDIYHYMSPKDVETFHAALQEVVGADLGRYMELYSTWED